MARRVPARLSAAEGRKFGVTVGAAFLVLTAILWWRDHPAAMLVTGSIGGALVLAGLLIPRHLGPVERAWMALALAISKVTTPVFMAVLYFLVLLPSGAIMRLVGKRPLVHPAGEHGYWVLRAREDTTSTMDRQF